MKTRRTILSTSFLALVAGGAAGAVGTSDPAAQRAPIADAALVALARDGLAAYQGWLDLYAAAGAAEGRYYTARREGREVEALEVEADEARAVADDAMMRFDEIVGRVIEIKAATAEGVMAKMALLWLAEVFSADVIDSSPAALYERLLHNAATEAFRLLGFTAPNAGGDA